MSPKKFLFAGVVLGLAGVAAGCLHDDDDAFTGTQTLKQFAVDDIATHTSDTAEPVEINDLDLDLSNEDPAQYDDLLQSG